MTSNEILILSLCFASLVLIYLGHNRRRKLPLPPGPPGIPVLGNVLHVPKSKVALKYAAWGNLYGPIFHFRLFSQHVVVLTTLDTVIQLFDKRSSNYSDRPRQVMAGEMVGWNRALAIAPSGPRHRTHRKLINGILSITAVRRLWPLQESSAHQLIDDLFKSRQFSEPKYDHQLLDILRERLTKSTAEIIFGQSTNSQDVGMTVEDFRQYIVDADEAQALFGKISSPYAYLVDSLPWLRYIPDFFPFTGFKREARIAREKLETIMMGSYRKTRDRVKSGISQVSYVDACLSANPSPTEDDEDSIAWTGLSAYTAGTDTTIATMTTILLLAALNPIEQELAYKEIVGVVGTDRLPCLEDKHHLPYTSAFVDECMRLLPVIPIGLPHKARELDVYQGYTIPKGCTVIANIWSITHDPNVYRSPDVFDPSRFLPMNGTSFIPGAEVIGRGEPSVGSVPFGFGRRFCPGIHLATSGIWIYTACLLWAFKISLPPNTKSKSIDDFEFVEGLTRFPKPFRVDFSLRSKAIEEYYLSRQLT